jgi:hypothetical protein
MSRWIAAIVFAAGCAQHARPASSPLAPSRTHAVAPRVATFETTATRARGEERHVALVQVADAPRGADGVVRAIEARAPSLHRCYVAALKSDPALRSLKVPVRVRIGARGRVDFARADGGPARLDACVAGVVRRLSFPPGAPLDVEVPLVFRQG